MLRGRQLNGFCGLSWRSIEVFVIQGGAAQSILMAVHANHTQVTLSSTAYWITELSLDVVSCGSSVQTLTLIHSLLGWLDRYLYIKSKFRFV